MTTVVISCGIAFFVGLLIGVGVSEWEHRKLHRKLNEVKRMLAEMEQYERGIRVQVGDIKKADGERRTP